MGEPGCPQGTWAVVRPPNRVLFEPWISVAVGVGSREPWPTLPVAVRKGVALEVQSLRLKVCAHLEQLELVDSRQRR